MNFQKLFQNSFFVLIALMTMGQMLNAQWNNNTSGTIHTTDKVGIGLSNLGNHSFAVKSDNGAWQTKFHNGSTFVYLATNSGRGIAVVTNNDQYNKSAFTLKSSSSIHLMNVMNDGRVIIGQNPNNVPFDTPMSSAGIDENGDPYIYRMYVNGGAAFKEVKVKASWADYVFEEDYHLQSLEEVETHIEDFGFLPNTPSAEDIENNGGVELGAMTVKQQEKIEELFLHMIEMNKEVEALKAQVENLTEENALLKKQ